MSLVGLCDAAGSRGDDRRDARGGGDGAQSRTTRPAVERVPSTHGSPPAAALAGGRRCDHRPFDVSVKRYRYRFLVGTCPCVRLSDNVRCLAMEEEIEVVAFACRGTLVDWTGAIDAVVYELARRNGESPLDRGTALGRRVETLAGGDGLARGFDRLADERGYRGEESGDELLARVIAMARPLRGAREAVALATRSGKRVVAISRAETASALDPFGGALE